MERLKPYFIDHDLKLSYDQLSDTDIPDMIKANRNKVVIKEEEEPELEFAIDEIIIK